MVQVLYAASIFPAGTSVQTSEPSSRYRTLNESAAPGQAHAHVSVAAPSCTFCATRLRAAIGDRVNSASLLSAVSDLPPGAVAVTTQRRVCTPASKLATDRWVRSPVCPGRLAHVLLALSVQTCHWYASA